MFQIYFPQVESPADDGTLAPPKATRLGHVLTRRAPTGEVLSVSGGDGEQFGHFVEIVSRLLEGEELVFKGDHYTIDGAICRPRREDAITPEPFGGRDGLLHQCADDGTLVAGGEIGAPVQEITIASNLINMFATLEPASDLEFRRGIDAPTLLVPEMTVGAA